MSVYVCAGHTFGSLLLWLVRAACQVARMVWKMERQRPGRCAGRTDRGRAVGRREGKRQRMYVCVCVCVYVREREIVCERKRHTYTLKRRSKRGRETEPTRCEQRESIRKGNHTKHPSSIRSHSTKEMIYLYTRSLQQKPEHTHTHTHTRTQTHTHTHT